MLTYAGICTNDTLKLDQHNCKHIDTVLKKSTFKCLQNDFLDCSTRLALLSYFSTNVWQRLVSLDRSTATAAMIYAKLCKLGFTVDFLFDLTLMAENKIRVALSSEDDLQAKQDIFNKPKTKQQQQWNESPSCNGKADLTLKL